MTNPLLQNDALDFVANILYQHDRPGASVQWWALREELKEKYREQAKQTVGSWTLEQIQARAEADRLATRRPKLVKD